MGGGVDEAFAGEAADEVAVAFEGKVLRVEGEEGIRGEGGRIFEGGPAGAEDLDEVIDEFLGNGVAQAFANQIEAAEVEDGEDEFWGCAGHLLGGGAEGIDGAADDAMLARLGLAEGGEAVGELFVEELEIVEGVGLAEALGGGFQVREVVGLVAIEGGDGLFEGMDAVAQVRSERIEGAGEV